MVLAIYINAFVEASLSKVILNCQIVDLEGQMLNFESLVTIEGIKKDLIVATVMAMNVFSFRKFSVARMLETSHLESNEGLDSQQEYNSY